MEQNINTFIPHESKSKATNARFGSVLFVVSIGFLLVAGVAGVMSYLARTASGAQLKSYQDSLERSRQAFNTGLPIRSIEEFDKRLRASRDIMSKHKSFEGLFSLVERITLTNVQITSLSYTENDNTKKNVVRVVARAPDYKTIAEMNEQFSIDEEARRYITDVVFSNLSVDTKGSNLISFEIMFTVDPEFLMYSKYIEPTTGGEDSNDVVNSARNDSPNIKNQ
jgi:hypothetical protein